MNLKDDIKKIPNILSLSRIVLSPVVFLLLGIPGLEGKIISIVFLALLFLTDFFDGMLARMLNQTSDLGRILDPLADKALVAVLFIALVFFREPGLMIVRACSCPLRLKKIAVMPPMNNNIKTGCGSLFIRVTNLFCYEAAFHATFAFSHKQALEPSAEYIQQQI